jgi:GTP1/Obg family GTP-binding protein
MRLKTPNFRKLILRFPNVNIISNFYLDSAPVSQKKYKHYINMSALNFVAKIMISSVKMGIIKCFGS